MSIIPPFHKTALGFFISLLFLRKPWPLDELPHQPTAHLSTHCFKLPTTGHIDNVQANCDRYHLTKISTAGSFPYMEESFYFICKKKYL